MTKANMSAEQDMVANADDLLSLLVEETEEYPLGNGKAAVLRSLTYPEVQAIAREYKGREEAMALGALRVGLVQPQLTPEQWAVAEKGKAGPLLNMGKRIMVISGMADDDKNLGEDGASS